MGAGMSNPYVGEIRMFGGNFAPSGWALCQGQLLPISQYDVLFNLIGTTYGGDGRTNFALPNLQGMSPMGQGDGAGLTPATLGQAGGAVPGGGEGRRPTAMAAPRPRVSSL